MIEKLFLYIIIIFSAVIHEYSHGWMAYNLGDSTAKDAGRLTLNPLAHIDPIGTVILPLFLLFTGGVFLGWAKPVPYNPYNLDDQKYGSLKVGLAGPASNFIIALIFGLGARFLAGASIATPFIQGLILVTYVNIFLGLFNLLPIPPLDGSKVVADLFPNQWRAFLKTGFIGTILAIIIAMTFLPPVARFIFNLIVGKSLFI